MKQLTKFFVLLNILALGFLLGCLVSFNVNADTSDLTYNFDSDVLYNQDNNNNNFYGDFNTREYSVYNNTGIYSGNFSFEGNLDDWTLAEGGGSITIEKTEAGHIDVMLLNDTLTTDYVMAYKNDVIGEYTTGAIELWCRLSATNVISTLRFGETNGWADSINLQWRNDANLVHIGSSTEVICSYVANKWYHITLKWFVLGTSNRYMEVYIDGSLELSTTLFKDAQNTFLHVDSMCFYTGGTDIKKMWIDAIGFYIGADYTGEHFDISVETTYPKGITWDNNSFWVIDSTHAKVYNYYANGTYSGTYFNVSSEDVSPDGIVWDGNSFWITGQITDKVYKYYANGTYTGIYFNVSSEDCSVEGITWDGEFFWVVGNDNDEVYKYYANGSYTGAHFDVGVQDNYPKGIIWDGDSFWVVSSTTDTLYQYNSNGVYTENFINLISITFPEGLAWDGEYLWITSYPDWEVYKYVDMLHDYELGDNIEETILYVESGTEPDKWEFTHEGLFDHLQDGDDNPTGWTDLEDGGDDVNCKVYGFKNNMKNGIVEFYASSSDNIGLYKDNFGYSEDITLNVSFQFEIKYIYSVLNNGFYMSIFSSDDTQIVKIRIRDELTLDYWVSGTTYTTIDTGLAIDTDYDINLFVNYDTDKCMLKYSADGVFIDSFEFPLTTTGKTGLKKVSFDVFADTDYCQVYLDSIGIYVNNRSITTDYAYIGLHVCDHTYWHFEEFNILKLDIIGDGINIYLDNGYYVSQMSPANQPEPLVSVYDYTEIKIYNVYNFLYDDYWGRDYIWGGVLWFLFNDTFEFKEILIEGVKMVHGENEYPLEFAHSGIDVSNNYFYVNDNKLYFSQTSNDNNLEYIQATFNIDNILTINRSISYSSIINGNAYGSLGVFYTDTTLTSLSLQTPTSAPNVILPQDKTIYSFIILITDNDVDSIQGTTTGYITNIKLIYLPDISLSIITLNLMLILIPLLILIIPTLLIYSRFGKSTIVPVFLLMTFICFISNLIPLWLFFIILLSCGAFIFVQKTVYKEAL